MSRQCVGNNCSMETTDWWLGGSSRIRSMVEHFSADYQRCNLVSTHSLFLRSRKESSFFSYSPTPALSSPPNSRVVFLCAYLFDVRKKDSSHNVSLAFQRVLTKSNKTMFGWENIVGSSHFGWEIYQPLLIIKPRVIVNALVILDVFWLILANSTNP